MSGASAIHASAGWPNFGKLPASSRPDSSARLTGHHRLVSGEPLGRGCRPAASVVERTDTHAHASRDAACMSRGEALGLQIAHRLSRVRAVLEQPDLHDQPARRLRFGRRGFRRGRRRGRRWRCGLGSGGGRPWFGGRRREWRRRRQRLCVAATAFAGDLAAGPPSADRRAAASPASPDFGDCSAVS